MKFECVQNIIVVNIKKKKIYKTIYISYLVDTYKYTLTNAIK